MLSASSNSASIDAQDDPRLVVAFASTDGETVNQHFGSARRFLVMRFDETTSDIIFDQDFAQEKQDGNEDKLVGKIAWLRESEVDVLVCAQVGQSAVGQLLKAGVQPIAVEGKPMVLEVLAQLQKDLTTQASWTKRVTRSKGSSTDRIDALFDEDWDEG